MSTVPLPAGGSGGKIPRVPSPGYDLGPVAESPISDHAVLGSSSSLPFGRSSGLDEAPIPVPSLPGDNASVPYNGGLASMVDSCNIPTAGSNTPQATRRDTDGGNAEPALPIICIAPFDVNCMKYLRDVFYPPDSSRSKILTLQPGVWEFKRPGIPLGWKAHECPEGKLYFYYKSRRLLTMIDIENDQNRRQIERAGDDLLSQLASMDAPDDAEITLMKTHHGEEEAIGYYVASMSHQRIFWFKEVEVSYVTNGERAVVSEMHLEKAVREQFWQHVEMFPNHRGLLGVAIRELKDAFAYGLCEDEINPVNTAAAARLLYSIYKERFLHFHGEAGARLDRKDSAYKADIRGPRSIIFNFILPLLFYMPSMYLEKLEGISVDSSFYNLYWSQFVEALKRDWEGSIIPATVLLSANVGFLAINSIDTTSPNKSAAQISSYISSIFSLGIFIVAQILSRRHLLFVNRQPQPRDMLQFTIAGESRLIGLEGVAVAFSLPTALFLWSAVAFIVALMFIFFENGSFATKVVMGVVIGFMGIVVILLLYME
ncbi:uncharacterized protein PHACADRAFT_182485 [Phanerochaete carnosa HHB-10118-sp]|uniref:WW domain-containing protein n=1 Tax=Phanerochaete carnosa (strain HHB-10118-sp) TaxID=650164 RepID=K5X5F8_PHACS|nr:uncharacterized protein PHACADRAFT_182485 [Phanerochaete carnosa HHB-10118-sp]EKM58097.1 hypothetical protein PHACADRAFT_182485 [Phanerochaete carnosa HHB-10118-sp]